MSILFFHFDGTDNSPKDACETAPGLHSITNVLKSHLLLGGSLKPTLQQTNPHLTHLSFYYAGIGTYGNWFEQKINAAFAIESGDIASILNRAVNDFKTHYTPTTEKVVLIGFSRGAALARRFAALITPLLDRPIIIEAVIDTVASMGWPNLDKTQRPKTEVVFEHGNTLPSGVQQALHLVALDEQRIVFQPTLMNQDGRALEVWLPGVHSDIGGGYRKDGIGDVALSLLIKWIEGQTRQKCYQKAQLIHKPIKYWQPLIKITPNPLGKIHYQMRDSILWEYITLSARHCCALTNDQPDPKISPYWHQSVSQRVRNKEGYIPLAHCPTPVKIYLSIV